MRRLRLDRRASRTHRAALLPRLKPSLAAKRTRGVTNHRAELAGHEPIPAPRRVGVRLPLGRTAMLPVCTQAVAQAANPAMRTITRAAALLAHMRAARQTRATEAVTEVKQESGERAHPLEAPEVGVP